MIAFEFIGSTGCAMPLRRVDLSSLARRFGEVEAPAPRRDHSRVKRIALLALILLGAVGDTVLVARPEAVASCLQGAPPASTSVQTAA